jgi:CubicO group peptidase (beta-lactamase class C family)
MTKFEETAQALVHKHKIPGTTVGIARNGNLIYDKGFGYRRIRDEQPINPDTVFGIGSITKSMTCVAIMQLQESGKLQVHDPVVKYLPEFRMKGDDRSQNMTIHHFMTHSAGIPPLSSLLFAMMRTMEIDPSVEDYRGLMIDKNNQGPIDTYEQLLQFIGEQNIELLGDPGTRFSYSNDSYALLGAIIERVSGQTYESYMKEYVFQPAGMSHTVFAIEELEGYSNITTSYASKKDNNGEKVVYEAPIWWDAPSMRAAGFVKSTVSDMLRYAEIFRNDGVVGESQVLSSESVKEMMKPHIAINPGQYYGYGLMITPDYYGHTLVEHGGNLKAIAAQMSIIPEIGITGIVMTNLAGVPAPRIMEYALNDLQGLPVEGSHLNVEEFELPLERLKSYSGTYVSSEGMKITIGIKDNQPTFTSQGEPYPIKAIGKNIFLAEINDLKEVITILLDPEEKPWGVSYHYREFPRVE